MNKALLQTENAHLRKMNQDLKNKVCRKYYRGMPKEFRLRIISKLKAIRDCGGDTPIDYQYPINELIKEFETQNVVITGTQTTTVKNEN